MQRSGTTRVIKKYSNRRLYDTAESRYITLDELAESIRRGAEVRVLDAQTGGDLTQATLAQIILEGRGAAAFLSVPILVQMIRMSDDALAEFFGRWLSAALELYQHARLGVRAMAPYNPLAAVPFAAGNVISRMLSAMPGPWIAPPFAPATPAAQSPSVVEADGWDAAHSSLPPPPADADSIESLRRELDELKASLRARNAPAPAPAVLEPPTPRRAPRRRA